MKKVIFTTKGNNASKEVLVGQLGECVYAVRKSVSETNAAIRWCNTHKSGDVFDCDTYSIEIK